MIDLTNKKNNEIKKLTYEEALALGLIEETTEEKNELQSSDKEEL